MNGLGGVGSAKQPKQVAADRMTRGGFHLAHFSERFNNEPAMAAKNVAFKSGVQQALFAQVIQPFVFCRMLPVKECGDFTRVGRLAPICMCGWEFK